MSNLLPPPLEGLISETEAALKASSDWMFQGDPALATARTALRYALTIVGEGAPKPRSACLPLLHLWIGRLERSRAALRLEEALAKLAIASECHGALRAAAFESECRAAAKTVAAVATRNVLAALTDSEPRRCHHQAPLDSTSQQQAAGDEPALEQPAAQTSQPPPVMTQTTEESQPLNDSTAEAKLRADEECRAAAKRLTSLAFEAVRRAAFESECRAAAETVAAIATRNVLAALTDSEPRPEQETQAAAGCTSQAIDEPVPEQPQQPPSATEEQAALNDITEAFDGRVSDAEVALVVAQAAAFATAQPESSIEQQPDPKPEPDCPATHPLLGEIQAACRRLNLSCQALVEHMHCQELPSLASDCSSDAASPRLGRQPLIAEGELDGFEASAQENQEPKPQPNSTPNPHTAPRTPFKPLQMQPQPKASSSVTTKQLNADQVLDELVTKEAPSPAQAQNGRRRRKRNHSRKRKAWEYGGWIRPHGLGAAPR